MHLESCVLVPYQSDSGRVGNGTAFNMLTRAFKELAARQKVLTDSIPALGFRAFCLSYYIFCVLALLVFLEGGNVNALDRGLSNWVHRYPSLRGKWCHGISNLGDIGLVKKACAASVILLFFLGKWRYVSVVCVGVLGQIVANSWVQNALSRPRPSFPDVDPVLAFAFPSGHTGAAVALFGFWFIVVLSEYRDERWPKLIAGLLATCAAGVAISRVLLLVHWASDVVGGIAFAISWLLLLFWVNDRMEVAELTQRNRAKPGDFCIAK